MAKTRVILELGAGNDLHGSNYTTAALRAVQDALHHSSMTFVPTLNIDRAALDVEVTIGVQRPELVDVEKIKASLPVGYTLCFRMGWGVSGLWLGLTVGLVLVAVLLTIVWAKRTRHLELASVHPPPLPDLL